MYVCVCVYTLSLLLGSSARGPDTMREMIAPMHAWMMLSTCSQCSMQCMSARGCVRVHRATPGSYLGSRWRGRRRIRRHDASNFVQKRVDGGDRRLSRP